MVACGLHGGIGYGTGLCGLYVDGDLWEKREKDVIKYVFTIQDDMMRFLTINELSETFKEQISLGSNTVQ